ncbi:MAG: CPBP family intramembrane metalloprotease [Chryseobacterium sp.]|nr:MAG: CPBP family intramembrane metalloprotease [Chryseobacterium sp.]
MNHCYNQYMRKFITLSFLISAPFWLIATLFDNLALPINLPFSALSFIGPALAAVIATPKGQRRKLLLKCRPLARIRLKWWVVALFIMPVAILLSYTINGTQGTDMTPLFMVVPFIILYLIAAYCEETGWTSYLSTHLLRSKNTWAVGTIISCIWAGWHLIPFIQTGNSISWIIGQTVWTILFRIGLVWFYERSGQKGTIPLWMHATYNTAFSMLPFYGSSYDPEGGL